MDRITSGPRRLSVEEIQELRRDMQESSASAKAELKRRRTAKNQKNSTHGIDDGIEKVAFLTSCYFDVFCAR